MALDITIVKSAHQTAEDARRVIDALPQFDVVSLESACILDTLACRGEEWILGVHSGEHSRHDYFRAWPADAQTRGFSYALKNAIFDRKMPVIYAERFKKSQLERVNALDDQCARAEREPFDVRYSALTQRIWNMSRLLSNLTELRDRNIAKNIPERIETRVRAVYPALSGTLHYGIIIGAAHNVERYTAAEVLNFVNANDIDLLLGTSASQSETPTPEAEPLMRIQYLCTLARAYLGVSQQERLRMGAQFLPNAAQFDDLPSFSETLAAAEQRRRPQTIVNYLQSKGVQITNTHPSAGHPTA